MSTYKWHISDKSLLWDRRKHAASCIIECLTGGVETESSTITSDITSDRTFTSIPRECVEVEVFLGVFEPWVEEAKGVHGVMLACGFCG